MRVDSEPDFDGMGDFSTFLKIIFFSLTKAGYLVWFGLNFTSASLPILLILILKKTML